MGGESAEPGFGPRTTSRPRLVALGLAAALTIGLVLGAGLPGGGVAQAAPSPSPGSEESTSSTTPPEESSRPVTIDHGDPTPDGRVTVTGDKAPGATVHIRIGDATEPSCIRDGDESSYRCELRGLPSGDSIRIGATQRDAAGTTSEASTSVSFIAAPSINPAPVAAFGIIGGRGYPGATVTVTINGSSTVTATVGSDGSWVVSLEELGLPAGSYRLSATQTAPFGTKPVSARSAEVTTRLESERPAAPELRAPRDGAVVPASGTRASGTGVPGATVTVGYGNADHEGVACSAPVADDGSWSCTIDGGGPGGDFRLSASQRTEAGMTSTPSTAVTISFAQDPTASPDTDDETATPEDTARPENPATPSPTAPPEGQDTSDEPEDGQSSTPGAPGEDGTSPAGPEQGGDDEGPSPVASMLTAQSIWAGGGAPLVIALALLLAVGALTALRRPLLAALPSGSGAHAPRAAIGRRPRHAMTAGLGGLGLGVLVSAAAGAVYLSLPQVVEPTWTRVLTAALIATVIVNAASLLTALRSLGGRGGAEPVLRVSVVGLVLLAATAVLSRATGTEPPVLFVLLAAVQTAPVVAAADRRRLALRRPVVLLVLGAAAVAVAVLLQSFPSSAGTLATETAVLTASAALGSAAVGMLPLPGLDGLELWRWSRRRWLLLGLLCAGGAALLLAPTSSAWVPIVLGAAALLVLGASAVTMLWTRVVRPALDAD